MITTPVITEAGEEVLVRRLQIFELDQVEGIPDEYMGEYTVRIQLAGGGVFRQPFDMTTPKTPPDTPLEQCQERSQDWYNWRSYFRYTEGFLYYAAQHEELCRYRKRVARFILENCLSAEDRVKIDTPLDYVKVYLAALCPEVTMEDLRAAARNSFRATYDGQSIFDAYQSLDPTAGSYRFTRALEAQLLVKLGGDVDKYSEIPVRLRAVMILGERLPEMISALDMQQRIKKDYGANGYQTDQNVAGSAFANQGFSGRNEGRSQAYRQ